MQFSFQSNDALFKCQLGRPVNENDYTCNYNHVYVQCAYSISTHIFGLVALTFAIYKFKNKIYIPVQHFLDIITGLGTVSKWSH